MERRKRDEEEGEREEGLIERRKRNREWGTEEERGGGGRWKERFILNTW